MAVFGALLLGLVIFLTLPRSCVHGRTHHHKKHRHRSIALPPADATPPAADPPALPPVADPPEGKEPPTRTPAPQPPAPQPPAVPSNVFDVRSFGAVGDGVTDDTQAFKLAWVAACEADSGTLLVPQGHSSMINLVASHFKVEGTLITPDGPDVWPAGNSRRQWLVFYRADGLNIRGGGLIDGRGEKWWNLPCKPHRERLLGFVLGASVVGVAIQEQHRAIYRSISAQNQAPPPPEVKTLLLDRKKSNVDLAHMWNKAVDGALGPVISALSSRRW